MGNLTTFSKFLIIVVVGVGAYFGVKLSGILDNKESKASVAVEKLPAGTFNEEAINVGVVTWGGYAGGQYFNGGFKASRESRFYKEYGILVNFVLIDDFVMSREAWKAGKLDLQWITADSFPTEAKALSEHNPKIVFQADWSRGGDAIVVRQGINQVSDLRGKKVAVAFGTPSHTFLLWLLDAGDLTYNDITVVEAPSAIDAATYFKAQQVDAAVVWSPDDEDCVKTVAGAKILENTKKASHIISDVFYAKADWINENRDKLKGLIEGWLIGSAEINSSETARKKAATILSEGLNQPYDFCLNAIKNTRLTTYGDNVDFFNIEGSYQGMKGEEIYTKMAKRYSAIGLASDETPVWRNVVDTSIIRSINLVGNEHSSENRASFAKVDDEAYKSKGAMSTKKLTITFPTGVAALDDNAKYIIQIGFADIARSFANARIRIEGNTDNTGDNNVNIELSKKRAKAVADHLATAYGFDRNRFVVVGNGSAQPVADNSTSEGRSKNRRTEFEILNVK